MERFFNKLLASYGKTGALIELIRPWNSIITGVIAIMACLFVGGGLNISVLCLFISQFLIWGGVHILNDYYDYLPDRINASFRPIASKRVSQKESLFFMITLWGLALIIPVFLGAYTLALFYIFLILFGSSYSTPPLQFEKNWRTANPVLGFMFVFLPAVSGAVFYAFSFPTDLFFYGTFLALSFLFCFALLTKDFKDIAGDRIYGKKTLAVVFGVKNTLYISIIGSSVFWILSSIFFYLKLNYPVYAGLSFFAYLFLLRLQIKFLSLKNSEEMASNFGRVRLSLFVYVLITSYFLALH